MSNVITKKKKFNDLLSFLNSKCIWYIIISLIYIRTDINIKYEECVLGI